MDVSLCFSLSRTLLVFHTTNTYPHHSQASHLNVNHCLKYLGCRSETPQKVQTAFHRMPTRSRYVAVADGNTGSDARGDFIRRVLLSPEHHLVQGVGLGDHQHRSLHQLYRTPPGPLLCCPRSGTHTHTPKHTHTGTRTHTSVHTAQQRPPTHSGAHTPTRSQAGSRSTAALPHFTCAGDDLPVTRGGGHGPAPRCCGARVQR